MKHPGRWKAWHRSQWKPRPNTFYTTGNLLMAVLFLLMAVAFWFADTNKRILPSLFLAAWGILALTLWAYGRRWTRKHADEQKG